LASFLLPPTDGTIDYLEAVSEGSETEFFQYLNSRGVLERLARSYPLKRKKTEVPVWLYIASDLSLRLHGMQSFHGYPLVIRTGGMMAAFGPEVGRKAVHPETGQVTLQCPGFNKKNRYSRQTPCDQDWLRKMARATPAERLFHWHNQEVSCLLAEERLFAAEGIFIGDASYVFVPDNPRYEGSVVMLFDESNHPVSEEELTPEKRRRCRFRRCYKWVELIHTNEAGEFFFFVAMRLVSGNAHESPVLYELVEEFLQTVGPGVMKWLIVDRGFLDGEKMAHLKTRWKVDTLSALRRNMSVLEDAKGLVRLERAPWQEYQPEPLEEAEPASPLLRERARHLLRKRKRKPKPPEKVVAFSDFRSWDSCAVPLTVVLTEKPDKTVWGLVSTYEEPDAVFLRDQYHLRESIEERHRQAKLFWDLSSFRSPNFNLVSHQVVFVGLTYTLLQMQLFSENRPELNRLTRRTLRLQMLPYGNHIVVYAQGYHAFFDVPEYTEIVMTVEEPGKSRLLRKVRRIRREFLYGLHQPRAP